MTRVGCVLIGWVLWTSTSFCGPWQYTTGADGERFPYRVCSDSGGLRAVQGFDTEPACLVAAADARQETASSSLSASAVVWSECWPAGHNPNK